MFFYAEFWSFKKRFLIRLEKSKYICRPRPDLEGHGQFPQVYNTLQQGGDPLPHLFPWLYDLAGLSWPATNHPTVVGVKEGTVRLASRTRHVTHVPLFFPTY